MDVLFIGKNHVGLVLDKYKFLNAAKSVRIDRFNTMVNTIKVYRYGGFNI